MSRGIGATFGVSTNDIITTKFTAAMAATISVSCWIYINGTGGGAAGRIYVSGTDVTPVHLRTGVTMGFQYTWSTTGGIWTWPAPVNGAWHHIALTYNSSSSSNLPVVYINGVAQTVSIATAASGSPNSIAGALVIGNQNALARVWDGMLAHFAYWKSTLLGIDEITSLALGTNPLLIRPQAIGCYLPLDGINRPEPDLILGNTSAISGTKRGTSDAPAMPVTVMPPPFVKTLFNPVTIIAATIAAYQEPDYGVASVAEIMTASIAAMQAADYGSASIAEILTAAITAFQASDYGAASASETISASGAAAQPPDYGAISTDEIIAATITAYQESDYGTATIAEIIAATIAAAQEPDFGAMTAAMAVAAAVVAYQGPDYGAITDSEIISAVIAAYQGADYGALSGSEIISVLVDAQQQMDYADMIFPVVLGFVTLTSSLKWRATPTDAAVNSAALSNARLYTATATDAV